MSIDTYGFLKNEFHFSKALIPYNPRNESFLKKVGYNEYGYPTCPQDSPEWISLYKIRTIVEHALTA